MLKFSLFLALIAIGFVSDKSYAHTCDQVLRKSVQLTKEDLALFKKSEKEPVLSGGVEPTKEAIQQLNTYKKGDLLNQWHVYFIRIGDQECFDSPSKTMIGLKERLNKIAQRRMELNDVHHPLRLFFVCGEANIAAPSGISDNFDKETFQDKQVKRNTTAFFDILYGLIVREKDSYRKYNFGTQSAILFLSDGSDLQRSTWDDDFALGHEIGHATEFNHLGWPRYFSEGQADFKGYLTSGHQRSSHVIGPERDVSDPQYKTIDDFFNNYSHAADNYQIGAMFAHFLYLVHEKQKEMNMKRFVNFLLFRSLLLLQEASPFVKTDGETISYKKQDKYTKEDAQRVFNFLASVTMQISIEENKPKEMTRWLCYKWTEYFGVAGPFKRYTSPEDLDETKKRSRKVPTEWKDCEDLMSKIR